MPGLTIDIKPGSKLHEKISQEVKLRVEASRTSRQDFMDKWKRAEERAVAYMPERDIDAARRALREGGKPQYTTIQIPYTYALLMASHTYWATVFLSRAPIMQFSGRHGEGEMQIQAMEALIDYQNLVGECLVPLFIWLFDVGKYGEGIVSLYWEEDNYSVSEVVETEQMVEGRPVPNTKQMELVTREMEGYHGNKITNIRPMDFFPDPNYPLHDFQKGDFCAVLNPAVSFNKLYGLEAKGKLTNINELKKNSQKRREELSVVSKLPGQGSQALSKLSKESAELYDCHIEIIPKEWGIGEGNSPEKWVFTTSSDFSVVIGARPLGYWHNKYPFAVIKLEPEGYSVYSRSLSDIADPLQNVMDWLINTHFYNVRKTLNNMFVVDPTKVVMKDVDSPLPGNLIRLKPGASGTDIRTVLQQLQTQDLTRTHMSDLSSMLQLGEKVTGIGEQLFGAATPSSRRSAAEIRSTNTFSTSRLKVNSEFMSAMGWGPLSQMMVQNSQQYYRAEKKLRIVGDFANLAGQQFINVTPESITGFYDLVPVDGTLPADRQAQAALWVNMFSQVARFPQILQTYDLSKIFAWVAQLAGLKNINQFRIQLGSPQQLAQQAEAGNVVPLKGEAGEEPLLKQVAGNGPTL